MTTQERPRTSRGYYPVNADGTKQESEIRTPSRTASMRQKSPLHNQQNDDVRILIPRPPSAQKPQTTSMTNPYENAQLSPRRRRYVGLNKDAMSLSQQNINDYNANSQTFKIPLSDAKNLSFDMNDPIKLITEPIDRPISSRLSKFTSPLPPIQSKNVDVKPPIDESPNRFQNFIPSNTISAPLPTTFEYTKARSITQIDLKNHIRLPNEPSSDEKDSILIGVTLPDGTKYHRHFLLSDHVQIILDFASLCANIDFRKNCKLMERPKKIIDDLEKTIEHYQLHNRTMLIVINEDNID